MNYADNFDEFGNLREDHSPWTMADFGWAVAAVTLIAAIVSGVLA